jgi:hypothetical protein
VGGFFCGIQITGSTFGMGSNSSTETGLEASPTCTFFPFGVFVIDGLLVYGEEFSCIKQHH